MQMNTEILGSILVDAVSSNEVPAIEVMTQGHTREEALKMIADAIEGLVECYFPDESKEFQVTVRQYKKGIIGVSSSKNSLMLAFLLHKREILFDLMIRHIEALREKPRDVKDEEKRKNH